VPPGLSHPGKSGDGFRKGKVQMMNKKNERKVSYRSMIIMAIIVGVFGILLLFIQGWEFFSYFLTLPVLGGLIGGSKDYEERDRQQLERSYKTTVEWLLLLSMAAYAFVEFSKWLHFFEGTLIFMNGHWPSIILSSICFFMGISGFQRTHSEGPA
jgi:hypothetical protein